MANIHYFKLSDLDDSDRKQLLFSRYLHIILNYNDAYKTEYDELHTYTLAVRDNATNSDKKKFIELLIFYKTSKLLSYCVSDTIEELNVALNSTELEKIIISSKYICPLVSNDSWYFNDRFTGNIALSYNYNKPLIIQNKLRDIYDIKNCLSYENTLIEIMDKITNISDSEYINIIKDLYTEKLEIINRNNKKLDSILC